MSDPEEEQRGSEVEDEEEVTERKKAAKIKPEMLQAKYPSVAEGIYREKDAEVQLDPDRIIFDVDGSRGQARPFSQATFVQRLAEFRQALPTGPIKVTLWPTDAHGVFTVARLSILFIHIFFSDSKFVVLSGQHGTRSLLALRTEWLKKRTEETLPSCLKIIKADILFHGTTVEQRQICAGTEQYRQEGHTGVPLSMWAERLWEWTTRYPGQALVLGLAEAVVKCGYRRPEDEVCYMYFKDARL